MVFIHVADSRCTYCRLYACRESHIDLATLKKQFVFLIFEAAKLLNRSLYVQCFCMRSTHAKHASLRT